jgi:hypothetical protein
LIRFFDRKENYYVHGENANFVAIEFHHSLNGIKYFEEATIPQSPFKKQKVENEKQKDSNENGSLAYTHIRHMEFPLVLKVILKQYH